MTKTNSNFLHLLEAAKAQSKPQRLLFLLAKSERDNKAKKSKARGTISPVACVDKLPEELTNLMDFIKEADQITTDWDMVFIAGMSGENEIAPSTEDAAPLLEKMASDLLSAADLSRYLILTRDDEMVELMAE
ncbi:ribonucleotide reductase subunit alpha [Aliikangiella sp. G2MR2-5]|uniref:ribonucleotide reductase subunit alpha n=1 Tax=Aliikangiella sp. G2MR2-5 TaxID=2788943 RepID=UPI0018AA7224|nr:ribonucleotide reductase subunit alpha [Aliikangiella sp. G2MR2-5]